MVSPNWPEVLAAINAQRADLNMRFDDMNTRIQTLELNVRESTDATKEWVKALKDAADDEHEAMRNTARIENAVIHGRIDTLRNIVLGLLGAVGLGIIGIVFDIVRGGVLALIFH